MTTVRIMLNRARVAIRRARACVVVGAAIVAVIGGCGPKDRDMLTAPEVLTAPYNTEKGDVIWAVAPLANESGVSFADTAMIADAIIARIDEVEGLSCLPLNRTLAAMRARQMTAVRTPADARALAQALGAEGLIVGTVTAYDPYDPPKLGIKLAMFARTVGVDAPALDPMRLQMAYTDYDKKAATAQFLSKPVASVSEHLDGANHQVQMLLRQYASGRHNPDAAMGWKRFLSSMDLYTQFAAQTVVGRLIEQERLRVLRPASTEQAASRPKSTGPDGR